jgi:integrase/recombinase XerD
VRQPRLFESDPVGPPAAAQPALIQMPALTADASLGACRLPYQQYLRRCERTRNTMTCFLSDLGLLIAGLGAERPVRAITRHELTQWLEAMSQRPRSTRFGGHPGDGPAPKTMARRRTFLKNFFGWLVQEGILPADPTATIALKRPLPALPELLFEDEVERLVAAASEDLRCHLLVLLLLEAGLKKEEILGLRLQDVDLSDLEQPAIEVHFPRRAAQRRERRMRLSAAWGALYRRYLDEFRPVEHVFACTGRNLNYILAAATRRAHLKKEVTLQRLRDVFAVRQLRAGVAPDQVREQLGLSDEAWYESAEKYRKLAFPA